MRRRTIHKINSPIVYSVHYTSVLSSIDPTKKQSKALKRVLHKQYYTLLDVLSIKYRQVKYIKDRIPLSNAYSPFFYDRFFIVHKRNPNHPILGWLDTIGYQNHKAWTKARWKFDDLLFIQREHQKICEQHGIYDIHSDEAKMIIVLSS